MIHDTFVPTTGIHNFRDYGGYRTGNGGAVKRGLLFRSGQHVAATDADLAAIAALDIRTVIDLRGTSERERNPCRRADGWDGDVLFFAGETSSSPPHEDIGEGLPTADYARARMMAIYTRMPRNPAMVEMFGRYFAALDQRDGASLVHCFAGKDRTGVAATLLLHVLGVSAEDQMAEFLLTNAAPTLDVLRAQSVPAIEARLGRTLDEGAIRALLEVQADYLVTFQAEVAKDHGSLDRYLNDVIGVDDAMRDRLIAKFTA